MKYEITQLKLRSLYPKDEVSFNNAIATFKNETPPFEFAFDFDESIPSIESAYE
jgi:hypothetical protein